MSSNAHAPVVVGVDGSAESSLAVRYAAWEADQRHAPLRLVHGLQYAPAHGYAVPSTSYISMLAEDAQGLVRDVEAAVVAEYPWLLVSRMVAVGGPGGILVEESRNASLVVVGSRGRGGFAHLLTGSVGNQVAMHAHSPVLLVRPRPGEDPAAMAVPGRGPVVVGVDGSAGSVAAAGFAVDEAVARTVPLVALHVCPTGPPWDDRVLAEALAGWAEKYPDLTIARRSVPGTQPGRVLLDEAVGASLLVVGHRAHGGTVGALLGSVSHTVVGQARPAVAIVRP